jgi:hypothetical protein
MLNLKICLEILSLRPVSEDKIENVINNLKGKLSAGIDKIPRLVVKKCMK